LTLEDGDWFTDALEEVLTEGWTGASCSPQAVSKTMEHRMENEKDLLIIINS